MKRSLIVLLVVALLATMVPTIALAAAPELTEFWLDTELLSGILRRTTNGETNQIVLQLNGNAILYSKVRNGDSSGLSVYWTTTDRNIAGFRDNPNHNFFHQKDLNANGITGIPAINGRSAGDAVLTGTAYWEWDARRQTPLATVQLKVHAELVKERQITINTDGLDTDAEGRWDPDFHRWTSDKTVFEFWVNGGQPDDITSTGEIFNGVADENNFIDLEGRTRVIPDPEWEEEHVNDWASTYGVSELIWSSSREDIAIVDMHGKVKFKEVNTVGMDDPIIVVITATAKGDPNVKGTVTIIIHPEKKEESPSDEAFKSIKFTQNGLDVFRGGSWRGDYLDLYHAENGLNLANYLELYPRPAGWYQGSWEHRDDQEYGNYGVLDEIVWTSSNENIAWICQDHPVYEEYGHGEAANPKSIPGWADCFIVVSQDAENGDQVTIRATSVNNPEVYAEIVLTVVTDDKVNIHFERNAYTFKNADRNEERILRVMPVEEYNKIRNWAKSRYMTATSSDPEVLRVDGINEFGVRVTPRAPGQVTVTLESDRYLKKPISTVVTVAGGAVKSVTLPAEYENITMPLYDVAALSEVDEGMNTTVVHVNINPADAWYRATWTSSDPSVAYVVYDGDPNDSNRTTAIRAAGVGECTITVNVTDGVHEFTKTINVKVIKAKATQLALNKTKGTFYLSKGGDNTLQLIATDKNTGEEVPVTWKSSDKKIAKVSSSGLVTFKKEGQVKITATTKDGYVAEKSCTVTVKKLAVKKISVTKRKTMKVGDVGFISYRISPAKAYNPALTFKSSNKKVVTVDRYGTIEALKPGTAEITVTAKDGSGVTAKVTITVKDITTNADDEVIIDGEGIDLTLDGIDSIEDLGIDDGVVLNNGDVIEITLD